MSKKREKAKRLLFASLVFFGYVSMSFCINRWLFSKPVYGLVVGQILTIVILGFLYHHVFVRKQERSDYSGFSGFGWLVLITVFLVMYLFSQAAATWIEYYSPSSYMTTYSSLQDGELVLYMLVSVTLAPLAEELVFRGFLYQYLRKAFGLLPCVVLSSVLFAVIHGTKGHLAITIPLTLFLCFVLECTVKFRYAVGFHIFYNILGISLITRLPFGAVGIFAGFGLVVLLLILALMFRPILSVWLEKGYFPTVESVIDKKRKQDVSSDISEDSHSE